MKVVIDFNVFRFMHLDPGRKGWAGFALFTLPPLPVLEETAHGV